MLNAYTETSRRTATQQNAVHRQYLETAEPAAQQPDGTAEETAHSPSEEFNGARTALAEAAAVAAATMLDPEWPRPEAQADRDPAAFAELINRLHRAAEEGNDPGRNRPEDPEAEIAAWAVSKDSARRARGIAATMAKEAKAGHQYGAYRTAHCGNGMVRELIVNAAAAGWLDRRDDAKLILDSAGTLAGAVRWLLEAEDAAHAERQVP